MNLTQQLIQDFKTLLDDINTNYNCIGKTGFYDTITIINKDTKISIHYEPSMFQKYTISCTSKYPSAVGITREEYFELRQLFNNIVEPNEM